MLQGSSRPFHLLSWEYLHNGDILTSLNQCLFSSADNNTLGSSPEVFPFPKCVHTFSSPSFVSDLLLFLPSSFKGFSRCWRTTAGHLLKPVCSETNTKFDLCASIYHPRTCLFLILFFLTSYSLAVFHCLLFIPLFFFFKEYF